MPPKKDEETLQREKEEKLVKLFNELEYSIEKEQYRLSRVVINAIKKVDPENTKVLEYAEKIPEQPESTTRADIESFIKLGLILMTPGFLVFLIFYKFLKSSEKNNKEYFDDLANEKKADTTTPANDSKASELKSSFKKIENMYQQKKNNKESNLQDKKKFKFSTRQNSFGQGFEPYSLQSQSFNLYQRSLTLKQSFQLQRYASTVLKKLI